MAPKDTRSNHFVLDGAGTGKEEYEKKDDKESKKRFLFRFRQWLLDRQDKVSSSLFTTSAASAIVVLTAVYLYRRRKGRGCKVISSVLGAFLQRPEYIKAVEVSLSILRTTATKGLVIRALVGPGEIVFQDSFGKWKRSKLPSGSPGIQSDILDLLSRSGSEISTLPESLLSRLGTPVLAAIPFLYLALVYKMFRDMYGGGDMKLLNNSNQQTRFRDVAGIDPIIGEMQEIVDYLKDPANYHSIGAHPPRGVLLHGPPGSGKTLLAQAIAGEANCTSFLACSGSEFCEMYVGRGAARVRSLFDQARQKAVRNHKWFWKESSFLSRSRAAIIFIDEFDALAKSRSYSSLNGNDERDQTLNQLLTEMDGFPTQENNINDVTIIVIAATNRVDMLDPAILRRFDRQIHVPYPDQEGRREILKIHARRIECTIGEVDWDHLASEEMTGNFAGSDLRNVINDAALLAVRDGSSRVREPNLIHAIQRARAMKSHFHLGDRPSRSYPWLQIK